MSDCIFCQIRDGKIPSVSLYEDDLVFAMLDIFPESRGHFLVIPKQHHENMFALPDAMLAHVATVAKKLGAVAKQAFAADGIKIAQYNGESAGQTVFHYHMHVVPAYHGVAFKRHAGEPVSRSALLALAADFEKTYQALQ